MAWQIAIHSTNYTQACFQITSSTTKLMHDKSFKTCNFKDISFLITTVYKTNPRLELKVMIYINNKLTGSLIIAKHISLYLTIAMSPHKKPKYNHFSSENYIWRINMFHAVLFSWQKYWCKINDHYGLSKKFESTLPYHGTRPCCFIIVHFHNRIKKEGLDKWRNKL